LSEEEFFAYSVFTEQKDRDEWRTFTELKHRLPPRRAVLEDYFCVHQGTARSRFEEPDDKDSTKTEIAGVGAALALASHLYGLTEADWERVPREETKTLDFRIASTGTEFVEVEAKGSIVKDHRITSSISSQKADIEKKKDEQRGRHGNRSTLIGVITAFPSNDSMRAKCLVLDPPSLELGDPYHHRLLARLSFYRREIGLLSRAHFLSSLATRIRDMAHIAPVDSFDGLPLLNRRAMPFEVPASLLASRSSALDGEVFGQVFPTGNAKEFYFYGLNIDIAALVIGQEFRQIASYRCSPERLGRTHVRAKPTKRDLQDLDIDLTRYESSQRDSRVSVPMVADLFRSASGRVFGPAWIE